MKANIFSKYGPPELLTYEEVETPVPKNNEVLIKIQAAAVNSWDWDLMRGSPFINRVLFGLRSPRIQSLGCDVAGFIEAIGKNITKFKVGDEVFGDLSDGNWGGFAEYTCAQEKDLTLKPANLSFEEVAALPQAAGMAYKAVYEEGKIESGQQVLINGAGGGVGSFAIQMAKSCGAEVTGVDTASKFDLMHSLGAVHVIDFTQEDFTKNGKRYDLIIDVVGHHSIFDFKQGLNEKGKYCMIGGHSSLIFQAIFIAPIISLLAPKKMGILAHKPNRDLILILEQIENGKLNVIIDKRFPLVKTAEALQYLGEGLTKGKVVVFI